MPESVPEATEKVGQIGPDASDPPRAGHTGPNDSTNGLPNSDSQLDDARAPGRSADSPASDRDAELDAEEGADAFETQQEAGRNARDEGGERDDLDHISLDTPD